MLFGRKTKNGAKEASATKGSLPQEAAKVPEATAVARSKSAPDLGPELAPEEAKRRAALAKHYAAIFGEAVSILMHSPQFAQFALADLDWLVVPAVMTGQFSITTAQSKVSGSTAAVAVVLWASVSDEIDKRLSASPGQSIRLGPKEWKSGQRIWVVAAVGDVRVLQAMLRRLEQKEWANKPVKMLARDKQGRPTIVTLGSSPRKKSWITRSDPKKVL
jgi:cytolysin-activating lysine-acyltransferase